MRRHHCWVSGWECALASAQDVCFSSLLGEVATFDGLRTVFFWSLGPGMMKMKCRARVVLSHVLSWPGLLTACYAGSWYICNTGAPSLTMVCRHRSARSASNVVFAPKLSFVDANLAQVVHFWGVHGCDPDFLVMEYGPWKGFGPKILRVYRPNEQLQWVSLWTLRLGCAQITCSIILPQIVVLAWHKVQYCWLKFTALGLQFLGTDAVILSHEFEQNSLRSSPCFQANCRWCHEKRPCHFRDNCALCHRELETWVLFRAHKVSVKDAGRSQSGCVTVHCPPQQQQFVRNMSDVRLFWISACA